MKNLFVLLLLVLPLTVKAQPAKITIDINREIGEVDPNIYGVFMEPIHFSGFGPDARPGNTLYGTLYDPGSPLANKDGFRTDYIEAARELKLTNMRWPGGNFVAGYNWEDGIGPKEQRPVRKELAWNGIDNNHVGTDEWVKLNSAMGTENVICINLGTGTLDDARYWVEYCNSETGSYYADLRAKYGNEKPFNVKYWCLGNEVDGEPWIMGYKNVEDYCKIAKEAAKVMRYTDRDISLVACGSSRYSSGGNWMEWNWNVINEFIEIADYISIHRYWEYSDDYYIFIGQGAMDVEEKIKMPATQIAQVKAFNKIDKPFYISFDEYGSMGRGFLSILATAQYLNSFIRHADVVKMANLTMFTSLLGRDREQRTFKTPLFHTFKLFSNNCRGTSVDVFVDCETFDTVNFYKNIPYLDVTSVYSKETGSLIINVVNRHKDEPIQTDIIAVTGTFSGRAIINEVYVDNIQAIYTFDQQKQYIPVQRELAVKGNKMTCSFPPHSFTQIKVKIKK
jgi:alpha-N-arabinofuranosidase